jgi:hypothetical protein
MLIGKDLAKEKKLKVKSEYASVDPFTIL